MRVGVFAEFGEPRRLAAAVLLGMARRLGAASLEVTMLGPHGVPAPSAGAKATSAGARASSVNVAVFKTGSA